MKNTLSNTLTLIFAGMGFLSLSVLANDTQCDRQASEGHHQDCDSQIGWYVGGQLGPATTDISQGDIDTFYDKTGFDASSVNIQDSGSAFSLMTGYQFTAHWAIEGSYIDLGERYVDFTGSTENLGDFYDNVEHVYPQSGDGLSIAVVGSWPLSENFKLSSKLGYWRWNGDYSTYNTNGAVGSDSIEGNNLWFGAELNYRLSERTQVYLSAQRFSLDRDDNNVLGLGIRYYLDLDDKTRRAPEKQQPIATKKAAKRAEEVAVAVVVPKDSDKDGVLDSQDECADSNRLHQVDAQGCKVMQPQTFNFMLTIYYPKDSFEIPSSYANKLQDLADFMVEYKVKQLHVYGHTSAPGSRTYNMTLSQKRAQSLADALETEFNIAEDIIKPIGRGEEALSDVSNTQHAHSVNRRIQLSIKEQLMLPVKR